MGLPLWLSRIKTDCHLIVWLSNLILGVMEEIQKKKCNLSPTCHSNSPYTSESVIGIFF